MYLFVLFIIFISIYPSIYKKYVGWNVDEIIGLLLPEFFLYSSRKESVFILFLPVFQLYFRVTQCWKQNRLKVRRRLALRSGFSRFDLRGRDDSAKQKPLFSEEEDRMGTKKDLKNQCS